MTKRRAGKTETLVGAIILLTLVAVAIGVFIWQSEYDRQLYLPPPAPLAADSAASSAGPPEAGASGSSPELLAYLPDGLSALTLAESFSPEKLSDKIDGKAELYLAAGFVHMRCQRFALSDNSASWFEVFIYDMGSPRNAFAVFSTQRRADGEPLSLTQFAYRTDNAIFLIHGSEYLEILASEASDAIFQLMLAYVQNYVNSQPVPTTAVVERLPFPPENLDEASITLLAADVFGFDRLNQVYVATYQTAGGSTTAFISERSSSEEAFELATAYQQFLLANGAVERMATVAIPGVKVLQVFDTFEVIFNQGRLLAGVHDAASEEVAQQLAGQLYQALPENVP